MLEIVKRNFCEHAQVLPEAASIVFGGGFPRELSLAWSCAAQRAIFRVQRELERGAIEAGTGAVVLRDRGTVDSVAYWPLDAASFWPDVGTDLETELARYAAIIHLRTPPADGGYARTNPLRIETAREASAIDERIAAAWASHPRCAVVANAPDLLKKVANAVALIPEQVPPCCRTHRVPELDL